MKSNHAPATPTLNHDDGTKLLLQFRKGLTRRCRGLIQVSDASETCREVTEMLRPYYEQFSDIQDKAEKLAGDWQVYGLEEMFGDNDIYPESFEPWADAAQH